MNAKLMMQCPLFFFWSEECSTEGFPGATLSTLVAAPCRAHGGVLPPTTGNEVMAPSLHGKTTRTLLAADISAVRSLRVGSFWDVPYATMPSGG